MNSLTPKNIQEIIETVLAKYGPRIGPCNPFSALASEITHALVESERRTELDKDLRETAKTMYTDDLLPRIKAIIDEVNEARNKARDQSSARNLFLAIRHLEDAAMRIYPPSWYRPSLWGGA